MNPRITRHAATGGGGASPSSDIAHVVFTIPTDSADPITDLWRQWLSARAAGSLDDLATLDRQIRESVPTTFAGALCQLRVIQARECAGPVDSSDDIARVLGHMSRLSGAPAGGVAIGDVGGDADLFAAAARYHAAQDAFDAGIATGTAPDNSGDPASEPHRAAILAMNKIEPRTIAGMVARSKAWRRYTKDMEDLFSDIALDLLDEFETLCERLPGASMGSGISGDDADLFAAVARYHDMEDAYQSAMENGDLKDDGAVRYTERSIAAEEALPKLRPVTAAGAIALIHAWKRHSAAGPCLDGLDLDKTIEILDSMIPLLSRLPGATVGTAVQDDSAVFAAIGKYRAAHVAMSQAWLDEDLDAHPSYPRWQAAVDALLSVRPKTIAGHLAKLHATAGYHSDGLPGDEGDYWRNLREEVAELSRTIVNAGRPEDCPAVKAKVVYEHACAALDRITPHTPEYDRAHDAMEAAADAILTAPASSVRGLRVQFDELIANTEMYSGNAREEMLTAVTNIRASLDAFAMVPPVFTGPSAENKDNDDLNRTASALMALEDNLHKTRHATEALVMLYEAVHENANGDPEEEAFAWCMFEARTKAREGIRIAHEHLDAVYAARKDS